MSNIALVWNNDQQRGDWQVSGGRIKTGNLLTSAVLISLFTDRVAQPDYIPDDGSGDRHGWWHDTFEGVPIGSRLWQLRRRKIANRQLLINEATDIIKEAMQWMIDQGIAFKVDVKVNLMPAGIGSSGNLLEFRVNVFQPYAPSTLVRALWRDVA